MTDTESDIIQSDMVTSPEITLTSVQFRSLSKEEKYGIVLDFVTTTKRIPSTLHRIEPERMIGQFLINAKSAVKNGTAKEWEAAKISEIMAMVPTKTTRLDRINKIVEFCELHKKTPSQSSRDESERKLGQLLNMIKNISKNGGLTLEEADAFKQIHQFRSNHQKSRAEKLQEILTFCNQAKRTPRQHVKDNPVEKRMAELLSTTKALSGRGSIDGKSKKILTKILEFAPLNRNEKMTELMDFVTTHRHAPKINSNSSIERQLSSFFTKMKSFLKAGELNETDSSDLKKIIELANVKSRLDKINDLLEFTKSIGRHPRINHDDENERKFAMFFTNIKQARKLNKLNDSELKALLDVELLEFTPQTV
jgi:hypothetical protein